MSTRQMVLALEQPALEICDVALYSGFVERSLRLQLILRDAGFRKSSGGVLNGGIRLVSRVAKREGLSDWPNTQSWADYDALIAAVTDELANRHCE